MAFHPEKYECEVIPISTKKAPVIHKYSLHCHTFSSVFHIKYPGVQISPDLKWNTRINSVSSEANQFSDKKFTDQFKHNQRQSLEIPCSPKT